MHLMMLSFLYFLWRIIFEIADVVVCRQFLNWVGATKRDLLTFFNLYVPIVSDRLSCEQL